MLVGVSNFIHEYESPFSFGTREASSASILVFSHPNGDLASLFLERVSRRQSLETAWRQSPTVNAKRARHRWGDGPDVRIESKSSPTRIRT
jgi:hypothetical protein